MGNETRTEEEQMLVQFTFQILKYLLFFVSFLLSFWYDLESVSRPSVETGTCGLAELCEAIGIDWRLPLGIMQSSLCFWQVQTHHLPSFMVQFSQYMLKSCHEKHFVFSLVHNVYMMSIVICKLCFCFHRENKYLIMGYVLIHIHNQEIAQL